MISCIHMKLWSIDPLLARGLEANNRTAAVTVQQHSKHASTTTELLLDKHVPAAMVTHAMRETGCCLRGLHQGVIKKRELGQPVG
jgi:hypothetical protein